MALARQKLAVKLVDAALCELGRLEDTFHYRPALEHLLDAAGLEDEYATLSTGQRTHAEVRDLLRNPLVDHLDRRAQVEHRTTR